MSAKRYSFSPSCNPDGTYLAKQCYLERYGIGTGVIIIIIIVMIIIIIINNSKQQQQRSSRFFQRILIKFLIASF